MYTGVQFTGSLPASGSGKWFTWGWDPSRHVVWYIMPTTVKSGAPELNWTVEVERAQTTTATYWITVKNLTTVAVNFEARYAVLN